MKKLAVLLIVLPAMAFAETTTPQRDPAFMAKIIDTLQAQRNAANDAAALQESRGNMMQDQITQLQKQVTDLQTQLAQAQNAQSAAIAAKAESDKNLVSAKDQLVSAQSRVRELEAKIPPDRSSE